MERVKEAAKLLDLDRVPRAQAQGALRWPAPARRHGPRDRPPAAGVLHGRAAVEPRRQAPGLDPHADRRPAAAPRRHHRLRHPRPGRGHDDGRPGRGAQGRHPAAGRHPAEPLRQARQPVRRRLHRLAGDEPAARAQRRRATPSSATSRSRSTRDAADQGRTATSPSACVPSRGGSSARARASRSRSPSSRSSARTASSTAPAAPRARPTR